MLDEVLAEIARSTCHTNFVRQNCHFEDSESQVSGRGVIEVVKIPFLVLGIKIKKTTNARALVLGLSVIITTLRCGGPLLKILVELGQSVA